MIDVNSDIDDDLVLILEKVQNSSADFAKLALKTSSDEALAAFSLAEIANQFAYANVLKVLELMVLADGDDDDDDDDADGDDDDDDDEGGNDAG